MAKLLNIQYLSIFLVLIFNSNSNAFFRAPYAELVLLFIIVFLYIFSGRKVFVSRKMIAIIAIWIAYNIAYLVLYNMFSSNSFFYMIVVLFIVYTTILLNADRLVFNISRVIYFLALISLFFYVIQLINFNLAWIIVKPIQDLLGIDTGIYMGSYKYANIFIYTLADLPSVIPGLRRNFGFMWEPGGFATVLLIGFFSHLFVNQFNIRSKEFYVYVITILSTFSTTGYLGLIVIFIYVTLRRSKINLQSVIGIILVSGLVIFIFRSNIVLDKLVYTYEQGVLLSETGKGERIGTAGRFGGLFINLKEFAEKPILGHYFDKTERIVNEGTASINGLGNILARFGLFGIILFVYGYYRTSKLLFQGQKADWVFFIILLICAFAFNLVRGPFYTLFFAYGYLTQNSNFNKKLT